MPPREALQERLLELRQSFDRAFSEPQLEQRADATIELLVIRVGRDPYAVRLAEIAALEADRSITSVPSDHPELLGVAGVRGVLVAVFDLAALLGAPRAADLSAGAQAHQPARSLAAAQAPQSAHGLRWLVLAKGGPIAFAFSAFDGQLSVSRAAFASAEPSQRGRVREVARGGGLSLPVIDTPGLIRALDERPGARGELATARRV